MTGRTRHEGADLRCSLCCDAALRRHRAPSIDPHSTNTHSKPHVTASHGRRRRSARLDHRAPPSASRPRRLPGSGCHRRADKTALRARPRRPPQVPAAAPRAVALLTLSLDSQLQSRTARASPLAVGPTADVLSSYQTLRTPPRHRRRRRARDARLAARRLRAPGIIRRHRRALGQSRLRATSLPDTELCGYWQEYSSIYSARGNPAGHAARRLDLRLRRHRHHPPHPRVAPRDGLFARRRQHGAAARRPRPRLCDHTSARGARRVRDEWPRRLCRRAARQRVRP